MVDKFLSTGDLELEAEECKRIINGLFMVFNIAFFASEEVRKEYQQRNGGNDNLVRVNDVFFGVHALTLSAFTLYQAFIYKDHSNQRISSVALTFIILTLFGAFGLLLRVLTSKKEWIDLLYYLSYIKLAISFIKYLPQARLNYLRKSTIGWSIHNILLDFTGGVLSIVQLILDAYLEDNWDGIKGDPVKFGLGFLSIAFDLIFIVQHYILYRNRQEHEENVIDSEPDWEEPLLKKGRTNVKGDPENRYV
ncbi:hypothetical protein G9A89_006815 [Geosiphon pyriformis]|nr:hypothetical protein G9A89_006815 [Geosiphon pyriformis]